MPAVITEVENASPRVLIIGLSPVFAHTIAQKLPSALTGVVVSPQVVSEAQLDSAYKVVVLVDPLNPPSRTLLNRLSTHQNKLLLVQLVGVGPQRREASVAEWHRYTELQRTTILELNRSLPDAQWVFATEVLGEYLGFTLGRPEHISKNTLYVWDIVCTPLSQSVVAEEIGKIVTKPDGGSVLLQGASTPLPELVRAVVGRHHAADPEEVVPQALEVTLPLPFKPSTTLTLSAPTIAEIDELFLPFISEHTPIILTELPEPLRSTSQKDQQSAPISRTSIQSDHQSETQPAFKLEEEVQSLLTKTRVEGGVRRLRRKKKTEVTIKKKSKRKTVLFYLGVLVSGVALSTLVLIGLYFGTSLQYQRSLTQYLSSLESEQVVEPPSSSFLAVQNQLYTRFFEFDLLFIDQARLSAADQLGGIQTMSQDAQNSLFSVFQYVFGQSDEEPDFVAIRDSLDRWVDDTQRLARLVSTTDFGEASELDSTITTLENRLQESKKNATVIQTLLPTLPELIATEGRSVVAVLFQNNQELRPTGGFIEAVALLTLEDGKLITTSVYSVYELDERLRGSVIPPDEVAQQLGEERWFLRDSNWDPHGPESAKTIRWFISQSTGVEPTVVVGMTPDSLGQLLGVFGGVSAAGFDEQITAQNLSERLEIYAESSLNSGDAHFPSEVLRSVFTLLGEQDRAGMVAVFQSLYSAIQDNQMFVVGQPNTPLQTVLAQLHWDGSVVVPNCPRELAQDASRCAVEAFHQVEANVGINKANAYVRRDSTHQVALEPTRARHTHTTIFSNTSPSSVWPLGVYSAYTRYYLGSNSQNVVVTIDGRRLPSAEVSLSIQKERLVVGFDHQVQVGEDSQVVVQYDTPLSDPTAYALFIQEQQGVGIHPKEITIEIVGDGILSVVAPSGNIDESSKKVSFSDLDKAHNLFGIAYSREN